MGVRLFAIVVLIFAVLSCCGSLIAVAVGPEGRGVTVPGASAAVLLALAGAVFALVAVRSPNAAPRRTAVTSLVGLCFALAWYPVLLALAEAD